MTYVTDEERTVANDVRQLVRELNDALRRASEVDVEVELDVLDTSTVGGCRRPHVVPTCRKVL